MTTLMERLQAAKTETVFWVQDTADALLGRRDPLVPPRRLMFDGPRDPAIFRANGQEFLSYYRDLAQLGPDEAMLDIGSGIGRKTIPLLTYLSSAGRYAGFDISRTGIDWCRTYITARYPNFQFTHVDVYNRRYNPQGALQGATLRFPYPDNAFDFAVAASVFTHMFADEVANYLGEAARVLKPGGRCLFTFFLLNDDARQRLDSPASTYHFPHDQGDWRVENLARPEDAVAYPEPFVADRYRSAGLEIRRIYYGAWCGRSEHVGFQDMILAVKAR
jgi:SAM-dependent methyltransferase